MHCSLPVLLFRVPTTFRHCLARHASRTTRRISAVRCCTTRKPCVSIQHARRQWGWVWDIASWNSTSPRRLGECCVLVNIHGYEWVSNTHTHTHTHLTALFPGLPRWVGTRKVKPIWILLKQETVSGSGIGWAVCKSAPCCRQITTPESHYSVFYRPDALPAVQPTASKHCSRLVTEFIKCI